MNEIVLMFISKLPVMAAILGAIWLAYHEKEGWGWLLLIAVIVQTSFIYKD